MSVNTEKTLSNGVAVIKARDITAQNITISVTDGSAGGISRNFQRLSSQCATYKINVCEPSSGDINKFPADTTPEALANRPTTYDLGDVEEVLLFEWVGIAEYLSSSLVLWNLNETDGTALDGVNANDATYGGTPVYNGGSTTFDGSTDYLEVDVAFNITEPYAVIIDGTGYGSETNGVLWAARDGATSDWHSLIVDGTNTLVFYDGTSNVSTGFDWSTGGDYHVASVVNGTVANVYVDGKLTPNSPLTITDRDLTNSTFTVMATNGGASGFLSGTVSHVEIVEAELTEDEVRRELDRNRYGLSANQVELAASDPEHRFRFLEDRFWDGASGDIGSYVGTPDLGWRGEGRLLSMYSDGTGDYASYTSSTVTTDADLTALIRFKTTATTGQIMGVGAANGDHFVVELSAGNIVLEVSDGTANTITSAGTVNDGEWHTLAIRFQPTTGGNEIALFLDGVKEGTAAARALTTNGDWQFGDSVKTGNGMDGYTSAPVLYVSAGSDTFLQNLTA